MPTLLYSPASPYSAKVRMAAMWCEIEIESRIVDTNSEPDDLLAANPLGKIPVLIDGDNGNIFDSRAIMQHLNRLSANALFPRKAERRLEAERLEALADGISDCLLAHVYERRFRPEDKIYRPWLDKQWNKVFRALDYLEDNLPRLTKRADGGQIALRATLAYLELRFGDTNWQRGRSKLVRWTKRFDEKFPHLVSLLPHG